MSLCISQANCGIKRHRSLAIPMFQSSTELTVQEQQSRSCYKRIRNSIEVSIIRSSDMNCCATDASIAGSGLDVGEAVPAGREGQEPVTPRCANCGGQSRVVSRKTVLLMLKPDLLEQAMTGTYSFCSARDCPVVYFDEQGSHRFTTNDLRVTVGVKASQDPIPLCYCFGFDEKHIRNEISRTGTTTVPHRISTLIREGLCACESRNPAGVCCLGEVNKAARSLAARE